MAVKLLIDNEDFVIAMRRKERWAVKKLYAEGYGMCENFILKNSGSKDDAFDCFQEAMVVVVRNVNKENFEIQSKLSTYLFAVTRNLWLKQIRSRSKMKYSSSSAEIIENMGDATEENFFEEKMKAIEQGLTELSVECRQLIKEYYYKKVDLKKLAENMGYSYKFVRVKKMRCMSKFKEILEPMMKNIEL